MPVATRVSTWLVGTVVSVVEPNQHARVIMVEVPGWPGSQPGQHLDLRLTAEDGYQAVRSYSIASYGPGPLVELAVDEFPEGEVSPYLVREVRPGDLVEVPGWPGSQPGPHLDLRLTAEDGYQAVRSYSIASYGPGPLVELAV
ncbi:MAG TPA: FAD-binding oxidoreductase, partial [Microlunatus sp.]|nr:FAD-binding oxidoreductase [Microlunatus sp.]